MARPSKQAREQSVHATALEQFNRTQSACRDERLQCLQDRRFRAIPGAMWEGPLGDQFENKPRLEVNKIELSVIRIFNEYRNNRVTVDFVPKAGGSPQEDELADTLDGLYRADEQDSNADEAYDNAFDEGTSGGFGAWRLRACYEDEYDDENDHQRIRIEPIYDADSCVFFDVNAKRQDKADANHAFVLYPVDRAEYETQWGDSPATWPKEIQQQEFDWATPDYVYLAEYYVVEEVRETVRVFQKATDDEVRYTDADLEDIGEELAPKADDGEELPDADYIALALDMLAATGTVEVRQKKVKRRKVRKYIMSGGKILEDCGHIAGKHIPIVPYYGKRSVIDGVERMSGQVRLAKDAQRLKNMQLSKLAEISALSSVQKPIFHPEEVLNHQITWSKDNIKDYPYLLRDPLTDANGQPIYGAPIQYTQPPQIPPAMAALLQLTEQDMNEILGNNQQAEKMVSNISGKAVEAIQQRLDMQSYIYMSNFAKAMKRCGEIWLSMAKDLYVEEGRKMKSVGSMNNVGAIELLKPMLDDKTGEQYAANDLSKASMDVAVEVGPSFNSKREAMLSKVTGLLQYAEDPVDRKVLTAFSAMNMDGEGIADLREYYRKQLVQAGVLDPSEEEAKAMQDAADNQQPDPQTMYLMAEAEKAQAMAVKAGADTEKTLAEAEQTKAKTAEILAGMDMSERQFVVDTAEKLSAAMRTAPPAV